MLKKQKMTGQCFPNEKKKKKKKSNVTQLQDFLAFQAFYDAALLAHARQRNCDVPGRKREKE